MVSRLTELYQEIHRYLFHEFLIRLIFYAIEILIETIIMTSSVFSLNLSSQTLTLKTRLQGIYCILHVIVIVHM